MSLAVSNSATVAARRFRASLASLASLAVLARVARVARWPLLRGGPSRLHASRPAALLRVARYATRSTVRRA